MTLKIKYQQQNKQQQQQIGKYIKQEQVRSQLINNNRAKSACTNIMKPNNLISTDNMLNILAKCVFRAIIAIFKRLLGVP